jgi:hypothetical protein
MATCGLIVVKSLLVDNSMVLVSAVQTREHVAGTIGSVTWITCDNYIVCGNFKSIWIVDERLDIVKMCFFEAVCPFVGSYKSIIGYLEFCWVFDVHVDRMSFVENGACNLPSLRKRGFKAQSYAVMHSWISQETSGLFGRPVKFNVSEIKTGLSWVSLAHILELDSVQLNSASDGSIFALKPVNQHSTSPVIFRTARNNYLSGDMHHNGSQI